MKSNVKQRLYESQDKTHLEYINIGVHATLAAIVYVLYHKKYTKINIRKIYEEINHTLTNMPLIFGQHITNKDMINYCRSKIGIDVTQTNLVFETDQEKQRRESKEKEIVTK